MTNVSQGGKEDGQSPQGAKRLEVHVSLCGWTKDCEEIGSPSEAKKRETQRQNHKEKQERSVVRASRACLALKVFFLSLQTESKLYRNILFFLSHTLCSFSGVDVAS